MTVDNLVSDLLCHSGIRSLMLNYHRNGPAADIEQKNSTMVVTWGDGSTSLYAGDNLERIVQRALDEADVRHPRTDST